MLTVAGLTQARTINGIDLDKMQYKKLDGMKRVSPDEDLSGKWYQEDEGKDGEGKAKAE